MPHSHKPNRLINESSPYLLQHAYNPVDWYPWGDEALEKAKHENKPVLLSIGYAACHWCHVMAHESFEDIETAELMNRLFVNIKVDREERPDLDKIYQSAHYLLTQQSGGWPLTIFLSADDQAPFFSGTYFPPQAKYQLPAFKDVLLGISDLYHKRREDIKQQNEELIRILHPLHPHISDVHLNEQPIQHALQSLQRSYDHMHGGFGSAPKFPQASRLDFLLRVNSPITPATLTQMAEGGIYDQLDGGFYRYSVDAQWEIPHFEKMLYDNGQLLFLYAQAYSQYHDPLFARITHETADWVMRRMQSTEGAYYSSIDADSEGHEGKYYIWSTSELEKLLNKNELAFAKKYFGMNQPPNFENHWHFRIAQPLESTAHELNISLSAAESLLQSVKQRLLSAREQRIPPAKDTKILTAWNALMIKGMLTAGLALGEQKYTDSALKALSWIHHNLWIDTRLLAVNQSGARQLSGYLDDYAFLMDALVKSLQVSWDSQRLSFAINLADALLNHFSDHTAGGFYFTPYDHEKLLYRPKSMMDEAIPSGNGIAASTLLVLGHLLGETRYLDAAEKTLHAGWPLMTQYPYEHGSLLQALQHFLRPPQLVILRGPLDEMAIWKKACSNIHNHVFAIPDDLTGLPGLLAEKAPHEKTCAYVCQGTQCLDVIKDINKLMHTCQ